MNERLGQRSGKGRGAFWLLLLSPVLAVASCSGPVRLPGAASNAVFLIVLLVVPPLAAVVLAICLRPSWGSWRAILAFAVLLVSGLCSLPVLAHMLFIVDDRGVDASFEPMKSVATERGSVVTYRTNGGATTRFGIVVRHEVTLPLGVKLVRNVCHAYPASEATVTETAPGKLTVHIPTTGSVPSEVTCIVDLRRFAFL